MYKIILAVALSTGLISYVAAANLNQKVDVCHLTGGGNANLQSVSAEALSSHLKHGDVLPGDLIPGETDKVYSADCTMTDAPVLGPTISTGAANMSDGAGVVFQGASAESEIMIGVPDLTDSNNRNEVEKVWNNTVHRVTFNWDKGANAISTVIDGVAVVYDFDTEATGPGCQPAAWDTMNVELTDATDGGLDPNVSIANLNLGGFPLGGVSHTGSGSLTQGWALSDFDFTNSFTLAADLTIEGFWDNGSDTGVKVTVGCS